MSVGMRRRAATTGVTLTLAGALGLGLTTPAAYAAGQGPCYDGRCDITVSAPKTIKVNSRKFGFGTLKVNSVSSRSVKFSATSGGVYLSGSTSPGGTVKLNNLKIWVKSVSGHKAKLSLFPTRY
ncbi:hypothetical protein SAMN06272771_0892 [Streptomyces sp. Ag82_O1-12]|uniref:hypothetical protein n=1 Tax=unclassified Streptomyces TaxID=2593676 RepID=UPI000BD4DD52|nr:MULTISPECIES: hypothetical protein [unclassified Streptomyces]SMQ14591.1 hypothetical protein SAMN06272771_0892 [Streptomyces sp. Ag82_O1-12]SOD43618.1 hypothetical protein SAMN06272727_0883 [Streptomyces sp. Ag82_G6-1]